MGDVFLRVVACAAIASTACSSRQDELWTARCANHFLQIRAGLTTTADKAPNLTLPATPDAPKALKEILKVGYPEYTEDNFRYFVDGNPCAESFDRDGSFGYVYVGDGLKLGDVYTNGILILFCTGENHRGRSEHAHAWAQEDPSGCVTSNAKMVELLQQAIRRGESGEVPYSPRAMVVLREELAKRMKPR